MQEGQPNDDNVEQAGGDSSSDDGYPWPSLLLFSLTKLKLSQSEFWDTTPRTFMALVDTYDKMNNTDSDEPQKETKKPVAETMCIDEAPSWW